MKKELIRIALIDDDKDDFLLISERLKSVPGESYDVQWFPTSSEGLQALKDSQFAVYLIDYRLDSKTGLDLLDEIQNQIIKKSVIFLTGKGDHEVDIAAMNRGASDFIPKDGITSEILERSIRYCFKRAQDQEKIREGEELRIAKEASDAASRAKSLFLANISHEIRTPLCAIMGFVDLALEPSIHSKDLHEALKIIKVNSQHLLNLINDILDLSKIEAGKIELTPACFNWREVIIDTLKTLAPKIRSKQLNVQFETSNEIPTTLKSDSHRFKQIILNLIGNAVKFTEKGAVKVLCKIEKNSGDDLLFFDISDSGIGLLPEEQQRLFKPFQQANPNHSRIYGGTGLGLDLSRKLANALHGDLILLSSEIGVGTTFRLSLPATFGSEDSQKTETKEISSEGAPKMKRVLLIEDSPENRLIVCHYLKNTNFQLDCAENGEQGIKKIQEKTYDLVLMDLQMPELDGFETTQKLRASGFKKPIVALTAHAFSENREKALLNGFTEYITKPINRNDLIRTITSLSDSISAG